MESRRSRRRLWRCRWLAGEPLVLHPPPTSLLFPVLRPHRAPSGWLEWQQSTVNAPGSNPASGGNLGNARNLRAGSSPIARYRFQTGVCPRLFSRLWLPKWRLGCGQTTAAAVDTSERLAGAEQLKPAREPQSAPALAAAAAMEAEFASAPVGWRMRTTAWDGHKLDPAACFRRDHVALGEIKLPELESRRRRTGSRSRLPFDDLAGLWAEKRPLVAVRQWAP